MALVMPVARPVTAAVARNILSGGTYSGAAATFTVLNSSGTSFTVPLQVLNSSGTSFTVSATVLNSAGTGFNPV